MAGVEFLPKLEKDHSFFLWTLGRGLRGPAGDTAILDQEVPPETSGVIMWSFKMGAEPVLGGYHVAASRRTLTVLDLYITGAKVLPTSCETLSREFDL